MSSLTSHTALGNHRTCLDNWGSREGPAVVDSFGDGFELLVWPSLWLELWSLA